nr:immunoglobulin heavy chain junction region [Macaca mulatta]
CVRDAYGKGFDYW